MIDVVIIGAGAAGLMCAIEAGKRGKTVLVLDKSNKPGKKILMSGGGRCNFTNYNIEPKHFISHNPHFCKSALARYTQWDFLKLIHEHNIPFQEKKHGQLFCQNKAKDILEMLLQLCEKHEVRIELNTVVSEIKSVNTHCFQLNTSIGVIETKALVIATGGLSIPSLGSSGFAYEIAEQFGLHVWPRRAGLVPFTAGAQDKKITMALAGISVQSLVRYQQQAFEENILFTHKGLSGPAILQISSYWQDQGSVDIHMLPEIALDQTLIDQQKQNANRLLKSVLTDFLPKNLVMHFFSDLDLNQPMQSFSQKKLKELAKTIQPWSITPNGTEEYLTAEVTLGGIDCDELSSKTMQANKVPGLYFIGEAVDVTGWLGGYNFQWAWSSGFVAGQVV